MRPSVLLPLMGLALSPVSSARRLPSNRSKDASAVLSAPATPTADIFSPAESPAEDVLSKRDVHENIIMTMATRTSTSEQAQETKLLDNTNPIRYSPDSSREHNSVPDDAWLDHPPLRNIDINRRLHKMEPQKWKASQAKRDRQEKLEKGKQRERWFLHFQRW